MGVSVADGAKAVDAVRARFPGAVLDTGAFREQHWVTLKAEGLLDVCRFLRDDPEMAFDVCLDVTAAHWPEREPPMEVVIHLHSRSRNDRLRLKVPTGETGPVPSLAKIWAAANWNEREAFDMFGIVFEGHPDLRRILMPEDYTDHPLRKEFPLFRG
jgi:NADH-quinone oxidoreductase subunit C